MDAINQMNMTEVGNNEAFIINRDAFAKIANNLRGKGFSILSYIIDKVTVMNGNILVFESTCTNISKNTHLSRPVIIQAIKSLEESEFLIKHSPNVWVINPNIMFYDKDSDNYMDDEDDEAYE